MIILQYDFIYPSALLHGDPEALCYCIRCQHSNLAGGSTPPEGARVEAIVSGHAKTTLTPTKPIVTPINTYGGYEGKVDVDIRGY